MNRLVNGVIILVSGEIKLGASEKEVYCILDEYFHPVVSTTGHYSNITIDHADFFNIPCEYEFMFRDHVLKRVYISPSMEKAKSSKTRDDFYTEVRNLYHSLVESLTDNSAPLQIQEGIRDYRYFYYHDCRLKISMARDYESVSAVLEAFHE